MVSDSIADMLIRIKNAYLANNREVELPWSKIKEEIAKVLTSEEFLAGFKTSEKEGKKALVLRLKYDKGGVRFENVKRISKPGKRVYKKAAAIRSVLGGYGVSILSTTKGIMTGKEARKQGLGGEVLAEVW